MLCLIHLTAAQFFQAYFDVGNLLLEAFDVFLCTLDGDWVLDAERGDLGGYVDYSDEIGRAHV